MDGTDLNYLFQRHADGVRDNAETLTTIYPALLADFLKVGDPTSWNGFSLQVGNSTAWPPATDGGMWFQVGRQSRVNPELRKDVCDFWDQQEWIARATA